MTKFRTNTPDAPERRAPKQTKPGRVADGKLGVYDGKGRLRGMVGPKATASTAARFHGQHGSKIGAGPDGKPAWIAPRMVETPSTLGAVSAQGSATPGATGDTLADVSSRGVTATQVKTGGSNG